MLGALLIMLREGLEAALIIGIMLAYLAKSNNRRGVKSVWLGTLLAVFASLGAGAIIYFTAGELSGKPEQIFEGVATLLAAGVLTWMIFWMRRQAINLKGELQAQIDSAVMSGSTFGLVLLAFVAVVREGIESVLFLFSAITLSNSRLLFTAGALVGLALAVILGYLIYKGASRLDLRKFFTITSLLLIIFAAGLLSHSVGEFHEAGIIPQVIESVWNTNKLVSEESVPGNFLSSMFGYTASPSLVQVVAYWLYLGVALVLFLRPTRKLTSKVS
jgi:high-affinity iron transporter